MAIYHMQAKVVSRGKGRSAVAASAYMSCSSVTNEYDLQSQANADSDEIQRNAVTAASTRLQQAYGKRFDAQLLRDSQKEISRLADSHEADSSIREQLRFASLRAEKEASYKHHSRETTPPAW